jgi:hypothetical protein
MTKKMNKAEGIAISALQTYYMALVRKTAWNWHKNKDKG